jgi:hypothetical protein
VPDSLLILAPLLVLAVVLLLGFAGCRQILGIEDPVLVERTLTFRAIVPTALTVEPPGVRFIWTRPDATMEEQQDVSTSVQEGVNNVYEHEIPPSIGEEVPMAGMWFGRCEMTARVGNRTDKDSSAAFGFTLPNTSGDYVLSFATSGSPATPQDPFTVEADEFSQE